MLSRKLLHGSSSLLLAVFYFLTNVAFLHAAEFNIWEERKKNTKREVALASLQLPDIIPKFSPLKTENLYRSQINISSIKTDQKRENLLKALSHPYGSLRQIHSSKNHPSNKFVVHIQDVHLNHEAQRNIGKTIQKLIEENQIDLMALEGAFGPIDLKPFHEFPHQSSIKKVADYLLNENKISGPIHAGLTVIARSPRRPNQSDKSINEITTARHRGPHDDKPLFLGVDDETHYLANVEAYLKSEKLKAGLETKYQALTKNIEEQKRIILNPLLANFDQRVQAFQNGRASFGEYVKWLSGKSQRSQDSASQMRLFLEALTMEESLNFSQLESERNNLMKLLLKKLDLKETEELLRLGFAYKTGHLSHSAFYDVLQNLCHKNEINLNHFPNMRSYFQYIFLSSQINGDKLLNETNFAETELYESLIKTEDERSLLKESRRTYLTTKLLDFSLTNDEWNEYKNSGTVAARVSLRPFENFYEKAEARDRAMAQNLLNAMERSDMRVAVLVAGGFHSKGISSYLEHNGVTIIQFVPTISKLDPNEGSSYLSVFTQEKSPLDTLFEGDKLFLAHKPFPKGVFRQAAIMVAAEAYRIGTVSVSALNKFVGECINSTEVQFTKVNDVLIRITAREKPSVEVRFTRDGGFESLHISSSKMDFIKRFLSRWNWKWKTIYITLPFGLGWAPGGFGSWRDELKFEFRFPMLAQSHGKKSGSSPSRKKEKKGKKKKLTLKSPFKNLIPYLPAAMRVRAKNAAKVSLVSSIKQLIDDGEPMAIEIFGPDVSNEIKGIIVTHGFQFNPVTLTAASPIGDLLFLLEEPLKGRIGEKITQRGITDLEGLIVLTPTEVMQLFGGDDAEELEIVLEKYGELKFGTKPINWEDAHKNAAQGINDLLLQKEREALGIKEDDEDEDEEPASASPGTFGLFQYLNLPPTITFTIAAISEGAFAGTMANLTHGSAWALSAVVLGNMMIHLLGVYVWNKTTQTWDVVSIWNSRGPPFWSSYGTANLIAATSLLPFFFMPFMNLSLGDSIILSVIPHLILNLVYSHRSNLFNTPSTKSTTSVFEEIITEADNQRALHRKTATHFGQGHGITVKNSLIHGIFGIVTSVALFLVPLWFSDPSVSWLPFVLIVIPTILVVVQGVSLFSVLKLNIEGGEDGYRLLTSLRSIKAKKIGWLKNEYPVLYEMPWLFNEKDSNSLYQQIPIAKVIWLSDLHPSLDNEKDQRVIVVNERNANLFAQLMATSLSVIHKWILLPLNGGLLWGVPLDSLRKFFNFMTYYPAAVISLIVIPFIFFYEFIWWFGFHIKTARRKRIITSTLLAYLRDYRDPETAAEYENDTIDFINSNPEVAYKGRIRRLSDLISQGRWQNRLKRIIEAIPPVPSNPLMSSRDYFALVRTHADPKQGGKGKFAESISDLQPLPTTVSLKDLQTLTEEEKRESERYAEEAMKQGWFALILNLMGAGRRFVGKSIRVPDFITKAILKVFDFNFGTGLKSAIAMKLVSLHEEIPDEGHVPVAIVDQVSNARFVRRAIERDPEVGGLNGNLELSFHTAQGIPALQTEGGILRVKPRDLMFDNGEKRRVLSPPGALVSFMELIVNGTAIQWALDGVRYVKIPNGEDVGGVPDGTEMKALEEAKSPQGRGAAVSFSLIDRKITYSVRGVLQEKEWVGEVTIIGGKRVVKTHGLPPGIQVQTDLNKRVQFKKDARAWDLNALGWNQKDKEISESELNELQAPIFTQDGNEIPVTVCELKFEKGGTPVWDEVSKHAVIKDDHELTHLPQFEQDRLRLRVSFFNTNQANIHLVRALRSLGFWQGDDWIAGSDEEAAAEHRKTALTSALNMSPDDRREKINRLMRKMTPGIEKGEIAEGSDIKYHRIGWKLADILYLMDGSFTVIDRDGIQTRAGYQALKEPEDIHSEPFLTSMARSLKNILNLAHEQFRGIPKHFTTVTAAMMMFIVGSLVQGSDYWFPNNWGIPQQQSEFKTPAAQARVVAHSGHILNHIESSPGLLERFKHFLSDGTVRKADEDQVLTRNMELAIYELYKRGWQIVVQKEEQEERGIQVKPTDVSFFVAPAQDTNVEIELFDSIKRILEQEFGLVAQEIKDRRPEESMGILPQTNINNGNTTPLNGGLVIPLMNLVLSYFSTWAAKHKKELMSEFEYVLFVAPWLEFLVGAIMALSIFPLSWIFQFDFNYYQWVWGFFLGLHLTNFNTKNVFTLRPWLLLFFATSITFFNIHLNLYPFSPEAILFHFVMNVLTNDVAVLSILNLIVPLKNPWEPVWTGLGHIQLSQMSLAKSKASKGHAFSRSTEHVRSFIPPNKGLKICFVAPVFNEFESGVIFRFLDSFADQTAHTKTYEFMLVIGNSPELATTRSPEFLDNQKTLALINYINQRISGRRISRPEFYRGLDHRKKKIIEKVIHKKLMINTIDCSTNGIELVMGRIRNMGIFKAIDRAEEIGQDILIGNMDVDTVVAPHYVKSLLHLQKNMAIKAIYTGAVDTYMGGSEDLFRTTMTNSIRSVLDRLDPLLSDSTRVYWTPQILVRASRFKEVNGFPEVREKEPDKLAEKLEQLGGVVSFPNIRVDVEDRKDQKHRFFAKKRYLQLSQSKIAFDGNVDPQSASRLVRYNLFQQALENYIKRHRRPIINSIKTIFDFYGFPFKHDLWVEEMPSTDLLHQQAFKFHLLRYFSRINGLPIDPRLEDFEQSNEIFEGLAAYNSRDFINQFLMSNFPHAADRLSTVLKLRSEYEKGRIDQFQIELRNLLDNIFNKSYSNTKRRVEQGKLTYSHPNFAALLKESWFWDYLKRASKFDDAGKAYEFLSNQFPEWLGPFEKMTTRHDLIYLKALDLFFDLVWSNRDFSPDFHDYLIKNFGKRYSLDSETGLNRLKANGDPLYQKIIQATLGSREGAPRALMPIIGNGLYALSEWVRNWKFNPLGIGFGPFVPSLGGFIETMGFGLFYAVYPFDSAFSLYLATIILSLFFGFVFHPEVFEGNAITSRGPPTFMERIRLFFLGLVFSFPFVLTTLYPAVFHFSSAFLLSASFHILYNILMQLFSGILAMSARRSEEPGKVKNGNLSHVQLLSKVRNGDLWEAKYELTIVNEIRDEQRLVFAVNYPHVAGPLPLAFVCHGWQSSKDEPFLKDLAAAVAKQGYTVIRPDFRNNKGKIWVEETRKQEPNGNESSGTVSEFLWGEALDDLTYVYQALTDSADLFPSIKFDSTLLFGHSYGGWVARTMAIRVAKNKDPHFSGLKIAALFDFAGPVDPFSAFSQFIRRKFPLEWRNSPFLNKRIWQLWREWRENGVAPFSEWAGYKPWLPEGLEHGDDDIMSLPFIMRVPHYYLIGIDDPLIFYGTTIEKLRDPILSRYGNGGADARFVVVAGMNHFAGKAIRPYVIDQVLTQVRAIQSSGTRFSPQEGSIIEFFDQTKGSNTKPLGMEQLTKIFNERPHEEPGPFHFLTAPLTLRLSDEEIWIPVFSIHEKGERRVARRRLKMDEQATLQLWDPDTRKHTIVGSLQISSGIEKKFEISLKSNLSFDLGALQQILFSVFKPLAQLQDWRLAESEEENNFPKSSSLYFPTDFAENGEPRTVYLKAAHNGKSYVVVLDFQKTGYGSFNTPRSHVCDIAVLLSPINKQDVRVRKHYLTYFTLSLGANGGTIGHSEINIKADRQERYPWAGEFVENWLANQIGQPMDWHNSALVIGDQPLASGPEPQIITSGGVSKTLKYFLLNGLPRLLIPDYKLNRTISKTYNIFGAFLVENALGAAFIWVLMQMTDLSQPTSLWIWWVIFSGLHFLEWLRDVHGARASPKDVSASLFIAIISLTISYPLSLSPFHPAILSVHFLINVVANYQYVLHQLQKLLNNVNLRTDTESSKSDQTKKTVSDEMVRLLKELAFAGKLQAEDRPIVTITGDTIVPLRNVLAKSNEFNLFMGSADEGGLADIMYGMSKKTGLGVGMVTFNVGSMRAMAHMGKMVIDDKAGILISGAPPLQGRGFFQRLGLWPFYKFMPWAWVHTILGADGRRPDFDVDAKIAKKMGMHVIEVGRFPWYEVLMFWRQLTPADQLRIAIELATVDRRMVLLKIPMDVQLWKTSPSLHPIIKPNRISSSYKSQLKNKARLIVKQIIKSRRPVVYTGIKLNRAPELPKLLEEFSRITGIPFVTSFETKGLFDFRSPHYIGSYIGELTPWIGTKEYVDSSDFILRLGDRQIPFQPEGLGAENFLKRRKGVIRFAGQAAYRKSQDIYELLRSMIEEADRQGLRRRFDREVLNLPPILSQKEYEALKNHPVTRATLAHVLDFATTQLQQHEDVQFLVSTSVFWFIAQGMQNRVSSGWSEAEIGQAVGEGAGYARTQPKEFVVVVSGDGGFSAQGWPLLQDLVKDQVRIAIVILDDNQFRLGTQAKTLDGANNSNKLIKLHGTKIALEEIANNFGAKASRANTNHILIMALSKAQKHNGPTVIVIPISPEEPDHPMYIKFGQLLDKFQASWTDKNRPVLPGLMPFNPFAKWYIEASQEAELGKRPWLPYVIASIGGFFEEITVRPLAQLILFPSLFSLLPWLQSPHWSVVVYAALFATVFHLKLLIGKNSRALWGWFIYQRIILFLLAVGLGAGGMYLPDILPDLLSDQLGFTFSNYPLFTFHFFGHIYPLTPVMLLTYVLLGLIHSVYNSIMQRVGGPLGMMDGDGSQLLEKHEIPAQVDKVLGNEIKEIIHETPSPRDPMDRSKISKGGVIKLIKEPIMNRYNAFSAKRWWNPLSSVEYDLFVAPWWEFVVAAMIVTPFYLALTLLGLDMSYVYWVWGFFLGLHLTNFNRDNVFSPLPWLNLFYATLIAAYSYDLSPFSLQTIAFHFLVNTLANPKTTVPFFAEWIRKSLEPFNTKDYVKIALIMMLVWASSQIPEHIISLLRNGTLILVGGAVMYLALGLEVARKKGLFGWLRWYFVTLAASVIFVSGLAISTVCAFALFEKPAPQIQVNSLSRDLSFQDPHPSVEESQTAQTTTNPEIIPGPTIGAEWFLGELDRKLKSRLTGKQLKNYVSDKASFQRALELTRTNESSARLALEEALLIMMTITESEGFLFDKQLDGGPAMTRLQFLPSSAQQAAKWALNLYGNALLESTRNSSGQLMNEKNFKALIQNGDKLLAYMRTNMTFTGVLAKAEITKKGAQIFKKAPLNGTAEDIVAWAAYFWKVIWNTPRGKGTVEIFKERLGRYASIVSPPILGSIFVFSPMIAVLLGFRAGGIGLGLGSLTPRQSELSSFRLKVRAVAKVLEAINRGEKKTALNLLTNGLFYSKGLEHFMQPSEQQWSPITSLLELTADPRFANVLREELGLNFVLNREHEQMLLSALSMMGLGIKDLNVHPSFNERDTITFLFDAPKQIEEILPAMIKTSPNLNKRYKFLVPNRLRPHYEDLNRKLDMLRLEIYNFSDDYLINGRPLALSELNRTYGFGLENDILVCPESIKIKPGQRPEGLKIVIFENLIKMMLPTISRLSIDNILKIFRQIALAA